MTTGRRRFLQRSGALVAGAAAGWLWPGAPAAAPKPSAGRPGYGPLREDPRGLLDLPARFSYRIVAFAGDAMADGFVNPSFPDGAWAFPGPKGTALLVRNHEFRLGHPDELGPFGGARKLWEKIDRRFVYDWRPDGSPCLGSVTTTVYDLKRKRTLSQHLSLAGTLTNCSGGPTPWGTWLSSEEVFLDPGENGAARHGYTFEVPVSAAPRLAEPAPLRALGRFVKEGAAVDPRTGVVYQTEDQLDGLFYRFLPDAAGRLAQGGRLQALAVRGRPGLETANWRTRTIADGQAFETDWLDLDEPDPAEDVLRRRGREKGAASFAGGEGLLHHAGALVFACTNGGLRAGGQIWRYTPSPAEGKAEEAGTPGRLELLAQPDDPAVLDHPDQLAVTPRGDLLICEDGNGDNFVVGLTPAGVFYRFARLGRPDTEPAGACFSPDGTTLFLNDLPAGLTFAVTGPWK